MLPVEALSMALLISKAKIPSNTEKSLQTLQHKKQQHPVMKKVLIIANKASTLLTFRLDMMKEFQKSAYDVVCCAPDSPVDFESKLAAFGISYKRVPMERNGMNPFADLKSFYALYQLILKLRPDKIFAYTAKPVIYGGLAAQLAGNTEFYPMICGLGSAFRTANIKTKLVKFILSAEYKLALKCCKRVMFQNHDDAGEFVKARIVREEQCCFTCGSGVNCKQFTLSPFPENISFIMIARLIGDKGVREYLQACKKVKQSNPTVRFLLIGPFDTNPSAITPEELQPYIDDESVEYKGEQADVRPYLMESSVFVLPSYHEGTPKSTLEAMAMGRPVITTDAPGCKETVKDSRNGFLVPVKNSNAIADKMQWFIEHSEAILSMGIESRRIAVEVFDVQKVNKAIMQIMKI